MDAKHLSHTFKVVGKVYRMGFYFKKYSKCENNTQLFVLDLMHTPENKPGFECECLKIDRRVPMGVNV